jgi:hypothetical protein
MPSEMLGGTIYVEFWGDREGGSIDVHASSGIIWRRRDEDVWRVGRELEFAAATENLWPSLIDIFST